MVSIKGKQDGLLVTLDKEQDWAAQIAELEAQLESRPAFFAGGRLALKVGERTLSIKDIQELQVRLAQQNVTLWAIVSDSQDTQATARRLNLATEMLGPQPRTTKPDARESLLAVEDEGWLSHRTLRSGQKIRHPGHVTIIGDVNPGAEIIAGGHVVVWGRLQGLVHAGAMGDDSAVVCALDLSPTQLRIGSHIARSPEEKRRRRVRPEMASVVEGRIVAEPWNDKKRRRK
jgi:septum site-determining protein MinC